MIPVSSLDYFSYRFLLIVVSHKSRKTLNTPAEMSKNNMREHHQLQNNVVILTGCNLFLALMKFWKVSLKILASEPTQFIKTGKRLSSRSNQGHFVNYGSDLVLPSFLQYESLPDV